MAGAAACVTCIARPLGLPSPPLRARHRTKTSGSNVRDWPPCLSPVGSAPPAASGGDGVRRWRLARRRRAGQGVQQVDTGARATCQPTVVVGELVATEDYESSKLAVDVSAFTIWLLGATEEYF